MDSSPPSEEEFLKALCPRISRGETLWVIMTIACKLEKLYVTCDTLDDVVELMEYIESSPKPLDIMAKIGSGLPVALKRLVCQNVTTINYQKLLTSTQGL